MRYVCVWATDGKDEGRERGVQRCFEEDDRIGGAEVMLCIAGDFNAHVGIVEPGEEESVGRYGWEAISGGAGGEKCVSSG